MCIRRCIVIPNIELRWGSGKQWVADSEPSALAHSKLLTLTLKCPASYEEMVWTNKNFSRSGSRNPKGKLPRSYNTEGEKAMPTTLPKKAWAWFKDVV